MYKNSNTVAECTLYLVKIYIDIKYLSNGRISSNLANTFRGAFGATLKRIVCTFAKRKCKECILSGKCAYGYIFETPIPHNTELMRKYPYAPHPLIILPPYQNSSYISQGKVDTIGITLIGRAIDYIPYIVLTFQELGSSGIGSSQVKFVVKELRSEYGDILFSSEDCILKEIKSFNYFDVRQGNVEKGTFSLNFFTPLRLQINGRITELPTFNNIIASLSRRITLLSYFHCGGDGTPLSHYFKEKTREVEMVNAYTTQVNKKRFSSRQKQKVPMNGFIGTLSFKGDYGSFLPLLKAGEYTHLGKDTIFGYGFYRLEVEKKDDT